MGADESLRVADLHAFVSQSTGTDQRQKQVQEETNNEPNESRFEKSQASRREEEASCTNATKNRQADKTPHKTRPELMAEMIALVAAWFPDRQFMLVVDSLYSGKSVLSTLPENFDLIGPVHAKAALYAPAPKETKRRRGPRRKKGDRLKSMEAWEKDSSRWKMLHFDQYGLHGSLQTKTRTGLYYKAGKDRLLRFVLSQDTVGDRPTRIFYSTNVSLPRENSVDVLTALVDRSDAL